jgi:hypothetical protein
VIHQALHAVCGVCVFKAGEAATHRRRTLWLAAALAVFARLHQDHHGGRR